MSDEFGRSVALSADGNVLAVSALSEDSNTAGVDDDQSNDDATDAGAVYVFERDTATNTWEQRAYVKAPNTGSGDNFGRSVALDDSRGTLAVGAPREDSNAVGLGGDQTDNTAENAGAVYLY